MINKHIRRRAENEDGTPLPKKPRVTAGVQEQCIQENGSGTPASPYHLPLRSVANSSECMHCPTQRCDCVWMTQQLEECYAALRCKREVTRYHRSDLCAKSILPPFVTRLVKLAAPKKDEVFYDFGCGNGSVLFQVAMMTGCKCVGIEVNPTNARVAADAWEILRPRLEARCGKVLDVEIKCADFCELLGAPTFFTSPCVIWAANLLLPRPVNHFLSERFREVPAGTRIFCFEDLYPHSRAVAARRDPDAFERFSMTDYRWQPSSVEWCDIEGSFYGYTRKPTKQA